MNAPKTDRHLFFKNTFIYSCQCPRRLWMNQKQSVEDASYIVKNTFSIFLTKLFYKEKKIWNGTDANRAIYILLLLDDKKQIQTLRKGLLKYCELNIWALLSILKKLKDVAD